MAKLSKKQAILMAELINSCTCWTIAVKDELTKTDFDNKKVREYMGYHDRDGAALNEMLGVTAIYLYNKETV
jgi:hypothetical protein